MIEDTDYVDDYVDDYVGEDYDDEAALGPLEPTIIDHGAAVSQRQELLRGAVDGYYNALAKEGMAPTTGRDYNQFELIDNHLRLKAHPELNIVNLRNGKPLALVTVASNGGRAAIREGLGFVDWGKKAPLPQKAATALQMANNELSDTAAGFDDMELQDLGQTAKEASDTVQTMETTLTNMKDPPLDLREIRGLDKALQTSRGELTNNLAKLTELDKHIALEKRKMSEAEDEFTRRRAAERLRGLQDERLARLEAASANREALRSQINRIRETINRVLNEDTTLAERIRTLLREHGVTIASILTAVGMTISTLVLAMTGGGAPAPTPPDKGSLKEWVKKHLDALRSALTKLAGKAAAALPGIIGSVVSWLLTLLAKTTGWLAENLWAIAFAAVGLLFAVARDWLSSHKPKHS